MNTNVIHLDKTEYEELNLQKGKHRRVVLDADAVLLQAYVLGAVVDVDTAVLGA